ncbi:conserved hypothetical protein [Citreicella sp. SE45]|nr:conserved hypothetical protein [Citreicella sp. SE45]
MTGMARDARLRRRGAPPVHSSNRPPDGSPPPAVRSDPHHPAGHRAGAEGRA